MTLNDTTTLTTIRRRGTSLGLVFAAVLLGSTLTACGSGAGDTTCGEFKEMSNDERLDVIRDAADDDGSDEAKDVIDQIDSAPDEQKDLIAESLPDALCSGEDDDTKLDDVQGM